MRSTRTIADRYRLLRPLGEGTYSVTYRAVDLTSGRAVAVKVLRPQYSLTPDAVARFEREARVASAIDHPNVVRVFDSGADGAERYLVMELGDGPSLKRVIQERGPLDPDNAERLTRQLLAGLDAIHAAGVVHRDVKPQNILLTRAGAAKLTDFGIARSAQEVDLTGAGVALGTVAYMAPEQATGGPMGPPADLYAVGVILFEMLTGQVPFPGNNAVRVLYCQVHEPPPRCRDLNPNTPARLDEIVSAALAKDPAHRFASAGEMLAALDRAAEGQHTRELSALERPGWHRRLAAHRWITDRSNPRGRRVPIRSFAGRHRLSAIASEERGRALWARTFGHLKLQPRLAPILLGLALILALGGTAFLSAYGSGSSVQTRSVGAGPPRASQRLPIDPTPTLPTPAVAATPAQPPASAGVDPTAQPSRLLISRTSTSDRAREGDSDSDSPPAAPTMNRGAGRGKGTTNAGRPDRLHNQGGKNKARLAHE